MLASMDWAPTTEPNIPKSATVLEGLIKRGGAQLLESPT